MDRVRLKIWESRKFNYTWTLGLLKSRTEFARILITESWMFKSKVIALLYKSRGLHKNILQIYKGDLSLAYTEPRTFSLLFIVVFVACDKWVHNESLQINSCHAIFDDIFFSFHVFGLILHTGRQVTQGLGCVLLKLILFNAVVTETSIVG